MSAAPTSADRARDGERPPHAEEIDHLLERLVVDPARGLPSAAVQERLVRYGPNRLPDPPKKGALTRLLAQLANPLVLTLLGAAVIAVGVGISEGSAQSLLVRFGDAVAIFLIVILNAILGFVQESRAEAAMDALKSMTAPTARVRRDGEVSVIAAAEIVPGDILEMEAGDFVPADARLLQTIDFNVEEAALTGESAAAGKDCRQLLPDDFPLAERVTMVFLGTTVLRGKGRAIVVATGKHTELGRIGEMISSARDEKTPLEERLDTFGQRILWGCLGISLILFGWGMIKGGRHWPELLLEAVSFAVAAIPEGLPAITTITLALGMQRMAKKGAVVRKLLAVETLGAASIICTDKTGTLTQNQMTVRFVYSGGARYRVSGVGYDPRGQLEREDGVSLDKIPAPLDYLLATAALCNNARLEIDPETNQWRVIGDPTEGALLTLAAKGGRARESMAVSHKVVRELPFDSDRKRMTIVTLDGHGRAVAHVKGSLEVLLSLCVKIASDGGVRGITDEDRARVQAEADRMSASALRVLAIARRVQPDDNPEEALTLLGIVGMMDPPRPGVKEAVEICRNAGVRVVMITGDHPITAMAIARELGLWAEGDEAATGAELSAMSDEDLRDRAMKLRVFARTTAEQKLRIVRAFRARGHVVAMTGDGVNDAPALKEANIGVAMGRGGTDVARQAADLVLADDNFATIVDAVREGRSIYRNIQKFIFFLLSSNAGLAVAVFVASFLRDAMPLTPLQILWINLVTNGLPALALGVDPADPGHMQEPPRSARGGLMGARDYLGILYVGVVMGLLAVGIYVFPHPGQGSALGFDRAMAFSLLALSPLFHAFNCRSSRLSILSLRPLVSVPLLVACLTSGAIHLVAVAIPGLRPVFRTFEMSGTEWLFVIALSAAIVPAVELTKGISRMSASSKPIGILLLVALFLIPRSARADGVAIRLDLVKAGEIKIDGIPREWPSAMTDLGKNLAGGGGPSLGMRGAIAYDEVNLYVAGEIKDPHFVRTSAYGEAEDHAALVIAFPRAGGGLATHEVGLYPGDPGKIAGAVRMKGGSAVSGAKIVEAPKGVPGMLTFEAVIPWRAFPEAARVRVGMRGALRYYDGDGRTIKNLVATSTEVSAGDLPRLPTDPEQSLDEGLLKDKGIVAGPNYDRYGDVAGDPMLERVLVYGRYLAIVGPHFREGKEYYFSDLGVDAAAGGLPFFELRDADGDGKANIVLRKRITSGEGWREVLEVLAMGSGDVPVALFRHEVGVHGPSGTISNEVRFALEGGRPTIEILPGTVTGYTAANYREPVETSMDPVLLPWGAVKEQVYRHDGRSFVKAREERQAVPAGAADRARPGEAPREEPAFLPPAARPPTADELQEQLYALYKRDRRVTGQEKPRFDLAVDLAEDARKERLLLHGRDLVVFGKGFKGGQGYSFSALEQFADPRDIVDVTARDLTSDGKAEILVRGVIHVTPSKELGLKKGTLIDRELLLVYSVLPQGIARVFGVETGRSMGKKRIQGALALLPGAHGLEIELRPGLSFGWTDKTYPFGQDTTQVGGMEPLLLPWGGASPARYRWNGSGFVK